MKDEKMMKIQPLEGSITLLDVAQTLWNRRWVILLFTLLTLVFGYAYAMWVRPQFTSDVLLQVNVKGTSSKSTKALGEMGAVLDLASPADAEIELIKSRMVLSEVVAVEHLHIWTIPIGASDRFTHKEGRMDVDSLIIPEKLRVKKWIAVAKDENSYKVIAPDGKVALEGVVGEVYSTAIAGDTLTIRVNYMQARQGQKFQLVQGSPLKAERLLMSSLRVMEKGKQTGIISVRYSHRYPDRAASILNTIAKTYLRQNVEMRSAEAEKTLEFLEGQLPGVKAKLDSAEKVLADYRHKVGSVDIGGETKAHLDKEGQLQRQIMQLEQERQSALRLFKAEHPNVQTIVKQQNKVKAELAQLKKNAEKMPLTQQEVKRLQEEVAVNNEVYTNMLNNIQQLRVVRAGEVGNVRIVDFAQIEPSQSKPNKTRIVITSGAVGFVLGILFVLLMRILKNGVRSASEIERATDMTVLVKIPQSRNKVLRGHKHLHHGKPFVLQGIDGQVVEAFQSMMTAINFTLPQVEHSVILVMGLIPGVGKSFVSQNLAAVYAEGGKKVLLIDADMRRGVIHGNSRMGLADVLVGNATLDTASVQGCIDNLFVLRSGKTKVTACGLLRSDAMDKLLKEAREKFDLVIVDTPPLNLVTDAELICPLVDYSLFVLHYGRHSMEEIKETVERVRRYSDKPAAIVMNHCEREPGHYGYGYGYYGKGYYGKKA
ncbi:polysaccharide biosynthesis tyrosine autokinase [uncultured Fibrobacter sp.]|uniref:polysaccharide biosynthesis tyrosine autokinase n=1 Tax=uncultured Fibrobacter sp. TaxID=261512 RepID=UPI0025F6CBAE|nr:polysaccharide biosynthesis tyrosine autokinase [uncultured Fibrobacter sp.]